MFQKAFGVHFTYLLRKSLGKRVLPKKEGYQCSYAFQEALLNHPPCWVLFGTSPQGSLPDMIQMRWKMAKRTDISLLFHYFPIVNNTQVYTKHTPQLCFFVCLFLIFLFKVTD